MQLTFASYNIHKGVGTDRRRDPGRILSVLREMDADIIALQEADLRTGQRASVLTRAAIDDTSWKIAPVAKRPRSIGWHGNAILVRREFTVLEAEALHLPTLEPRGAVRVDMECHGQRIRVVGTHLDLSGLRRRDQIKAILARIASCEQSCPTVIMGDFNQWGQYSGAMQEFAAGWSILPTGRSFPGRQPLARLDRIVASQEWTLVKAGAHRSALSSVASDHVPVSARLTLPTK